MKIILLSGGSGKRLWPLSNDARSKQFLRILTAPDGEKESMIQRVVRQMRDAGIADDIVVATGISQKDEVENQLGSSLTVVTEPCRRGTFHAILLACSYLVGQGVSSDETVVVVPCDSYTSTRYFSSVAKMADAVAENVADLVLMGISPTYPSEKYGYILPDGTGEVESVKYFVDKPDISVARNLITEGALWNGGVFAFRLGYLLSAAAKMGYESDFDSLRANYAALPKSSFDQAVVEPAESVGVVSYTGQWKDLGTWNTLSEELHEPVYGNVRFEDCTGTYIINELEIPVVCIGGKDLVIAASHDGILVSDRGKSEQLKSLVNGIDKRPMYEERRWGEYKVIDSIEFPDGFCALTKQLTLHPGKSISYQRHLCRTEVWTFISGEGEIVLDGVRKPVRRGDTVHIPQGQLHALLAITPLTFIEVQSGSNLVEEDIERFPYEW